MTDITVEVVAAPAIEVTVTPAGAPGMTAYQHAVANGFSGTEAEWLESLQGDQGPAGTIAVGTVTTGDPGTDVEVENVGTASAAVLNFTIPRGDQGDPGSGGGGAWGSITGTLADQTDLQAALDGKSATGHTHAQSDVTGLTAALAGKSDTGHTHAQSDVTGLTAALAGKSDTGHTHTASQVTDFDTEVSNNTDVAANTAARHTHANSAVLAATTASFLVADETKLDGIAAGATANSSDATLLARANHTGTQLASTISDFNTAADARVVAGITGKADLASPAFTGNPTAPTPSAGDNDTSIATTAFVHATRGQYVSVNAQTGTTYTPALTDVGALVTLSNTSAITVTLPQDSSVAFPVGSRVDFAGINTGLVTFAAGSGATVNSTPSLVTRARYSTVTAVKYAANTWLVVGDLA